MNHEELIQRAVFDNIRARSNPGVFAFHCPNGGKRSMSEGKKFKETGVVAGVPDIIAVYNGTCHALELKSLKGRLSNQQKGALHALNEAGAKTAVAYTIDEALVTLEAWGILKRDSGRSIIHRVPKLMETQE